MVENSQKKINILCMCKLYKIQISVSIKKVLLKHTQALFHQNIIDSCFATMMAEFSSCDREQMA